MESHEEVRILKTESGRISMPFHPEAELNPVPVLAVESHEFSTHGAKTQMHPVPSLPNDLQGTGLVRWVKAEVDLLFVSVRWVKAEVDLPRSASADPASGPLPTAIPAARTIANADIVHPP